MIFRYQTRCGTVYGHTGNTSRHTQLMAATIEGKRSVTLSATEQLTQRPRSLPDDRAADAVRPL